MRRFLLMKSSLLFSVHFKIFLGLQPSIGVLPHSLDIVWIFFFFLPTDFECLCWLLWVPLLIGFEFLCLIDSWSTTFIVDDDSSYVECIFFWISWRLVEVSFQHDHCIKSTLWFWKFITLSWGSVHSTNPNNFDFHDPHLFVIRKVRRIVNYPMLRVYYLPSEELTFTLKFRENLLDKTCRNRA